MLHIVQIVIWGVAETPEVFGDEAKARASYEKVPKRTGSNATRLIASIMA
jgi:hypothetical protein